MKLVTMCERTGGETPTCVGCNFASEHNGECLANYECYEPCQECSEQQQSRCFPKKQLEELLRLVKKEAENTDGETTDTYPIYELQVFVEDLVASVGGN